MLSLSKQSRGDKINREMIDRLFKYNSVLVQDTESISIYVRHALSDGSAALDTIT